ncbi:MAG: DUF6788 family protein [Paludibacter sp.]
MGELSTIKKKIYDLNKRRELLLHNILNTKPFVAAQVYERYKKCGNQSCKCQNGELHGPFLWIYQNKKGEPIISTTVDKDKHWDARNLADNYKKLTNERQLLHEIDKEINEYLNEMEKLLEVEVKDYATKRHSGRPKKS